jgi:hypothetical protein
MTEVREEAMHIVIAPMRKSMTYFSFHKLVNDLQMDIFDKV